MNIAYVWLCLQIIITGVIGTTLSKRAKNLQAHVSFKKYDELYFFIMLLSVCLLNLMFTKLDNSKVDIFDNKFHTTCCSGIGYGVFRWAFGNFYLNFTAITSCLGTYIALKKGLEQWITGSYHSKSLATVCNLFISQIFFNNFLQVIAQLKGLVLLSWAKPNLMAVTLSIL